MQICFVVGPEQSHADPAHLPADTQGPPPSGQSQQINIFS